MQTVICDKRLILLPPSDNIRHGQAYTAGGHMSRRTYLPIMLKLGFRQILSICVSFEQHKAEQNVYDEQDLLGALPGSLACA